MNLIRYSAAFILLAVTGLTACNPAGDKQEKNSASLQFDSTNGGITLPEGFKAIVVADNIGKARHLVVRDNGDVYIALNSPNHGGGIAALRDTDGDGKADVVRYFGESHGTGIGIHNGYLYFGTDTAVVRYKLQPDSLLPDPRAELIASLPVQHEHEAKSIAFDDKGNLYVNVGAPSNACQEDDRTKGSPGMQPCPILEQHAGIWRFKADQPGQTQENGGYRYSTGLRNCVALTYNTNAHELYAAMHGRDQLAQLFPQYYTEEQSAELPAEEFVQLKDQGNYGWPYVYYDWQQKKFMVCPEYGGDGKKSAPDDKYEQPIMAFPGHWAPNAVMFYTGTQFPEKYRNGAFIAFHGSWNRAPLPQRGYNVVFVPFSGQKPSGDHTVFADGFTGVETLKNPGDAAHRPCGLAQGPDGSLYVSDDSKGRIWRIVYTAAQ
ncbi:PQQ-dependent sugar dehydrogenase [Compostibacter hankyongensis]|uniref:Sorbosone dehydrogenase family protein n=1 Tax=Compostibacter hankyongensis TaxID=1007089 RepID=A0ABP8FD29_9BACT